MANNVDYTHLKESMFYTDYWEKKCCLCERFLMLLEKKVRSSHNMVLLNNESTIELIISDCDVNRSIVTSFGSIDWTNDYQLYVGTEN